jgi:hypothetical protein
MMIKVFIFLLGFPSISAAFADYQERAARQANEEAAAAAAAGIGLVVGLAALASSIGIFPTPFSPASHSFFLLPHASAPSL